MEERSSEALLDAIRAAKRVFVFTGAGASKESGLPTFREADGVWKHYDPMTFATMEGFNHDPLMVWNVYRERQKQITEAVPNPGHITLARMERYYPEFLLATQNVDDLHERAGSRKMVKIHGDAWEMRCVDCGRLTNETLPRCPHDDALCRPNIVWFGEYVPKEAMAAAMNASANCDLMLIVGTSGEVSSGYGFAEYALANHAVIVDVNPVRGALTQYAHFWLAERAGEALPGLWESAGLP